MKNHQSHTTVLWAWEYRDEEHPRPSEIVRLEALLNTVDHHRFGAHADKPAELRDKLSRPEAVKVWLVDHALADSEQLVTAAGGADVRAFRDGLRRYLEQRDHGARPADSWPPSTLRLAARIDPGTGGLILTAAGGGVRASVERLLADAVVAEAKQTLQRLKVCAAEDCRFAYYDHSRSRTSRWCSMQACGNRVKTRLYRQRRTAGPRR